MFNRKLQLVGLFTAAILLVPSFSFAETASIPTPTPTGTDKARQELRQNREGQKETTFCQNLSKRFADLDEMLNKLGGELDGHQSDNMGKLQQRQREAVTKLDNVRSDEDGFRQKSFAAMEKNAKNDAQLQAIKAFEAAVTQAIQTRRAAIDAAMKSYQIGVQQIMQQRQGNVQTTASTFESAVKAALAQAQSDCASNSSSAKTNFETAMRNARNQFQTNRKQVEKLGPQVEALEKSRNTAIQQALKDFKTALDNARNTLKAALKAAGGSGDSGKPTPTPTPTATPTPTPTSSGQ